MSDILGWPDVIRAAGLEVEIVDGFQTRSHGPLPDPSADGQGNTYIVWHHDASPIGPSNTIDWLVSNWDEASAQIWVDYNGKWWFVGSGMAYHAGEVFPGKPDNKNSVGIETDHTIHEDWPPAQLESLRRGTAALLQAEGRGSDYLTFHKEITSRKIDPDGLEIDSERQFVQALIRGGTIVTTTPKIAGSNSVPQATSDTFKDAVFNYLFMGDKVDDISLLFRKDLAPVNDQQLISTVQAIVAASLRSFMSGPDGSFIAFYPDYFGLYGGDNNYKLTLEDIELVDFKIDVNDDEMTTDVFVAGETLSTNGAESIDYRQFLQSNGVVNIRQTSAMALLLGDDFADKENFDPDAFYARFGLRPLKATFQSVHDHLLEYLQALTLFQRKWAAQYRTQVQFTFMPELYPGMRILIRSHNVTVFVEEVVHTGSFESGFTTTATISSPAGINGGGIKGMPVGRV